MSDEEIIKEDVEEASKEFVEPKDALEILVGSKTPEQRKKEKDEAFKFLVG
jgi:hypothetical protein